MNICPYYYELEDKFTCCACIQPLTTSADLFARHRENLQLNTNEDSNDDNYVDAESFSVNLDSSVTSDGVDKQLSAATKSKKRSEPSSTKKKAKAKATKKVSTKTDGFMRSC